MMGEEAVNGPGSPVLCNLTAVISNAPVAMETAGAGRTSVGGVTELAVGSWGTCWDMFGTFPSVSEFFLSSDS